MKEKKTEGKERKNIRASVERWKAFQTQRRPGNNTPHLYGNNAKAQTLTLNEAGQLILLEPF